MYHEECLAPEQCPDLSCATPLITSPTAVTVGNNLGLIDVPTQFVIQFDLKFDGQITVEASEQVILQLVHADKDDDKECLLRLSIQNPHYKVLKIDWECKSNFQVKQDKLPDNWATLAAGGVWSRWRLGRTKNLATGQLEDFLQIDDTVVYGEKNDDPTIWSNMNLFGGSSTGSTALLADATLDKLVFHSAEDYHDIHECFLETWSDWGDCSVTCGGGVKVREGLKDGIRRQETVACNTALCLPNPDDHDICVCPDNQWSCYGPCEDNETCQRTSWTQLKCGVSQ